MKKILVVLSAFILALGMSGVAGAYTINYANLGSEPLQYKSPYTGAPGYITEDFEDAILIWTGSGDGVIYQGDVPNKASAPAQKDGSKDPTGSYLSVPIDTAGDDIYYAKFSLSEEYNYFGLWWGSVDAYNVLQFYNNGALHTTITGSQAINPSVANGNQTAPGTNLYVNIHGLPWYDEFRMTSNKYAFETDNVTVGVPEPTTLLLLGFGLLGLAGIRRKL